MIYHERKILTTLRRHFDGHKYQLMNTYIFNWESDYFGITSSGYIYEIEVKISRSDFKADLKKVNKHSAIKGTVNKETKFTQRGQTCYEFDYPETTWERIIDKKTGRSDYNKILKGTYRTCRAWTYGEINKKHIDMNPRYLYSTVDIRNIPKVPNRFYYCAPKGMIKVHEVPAYAGLITIENNCIEVVKTAPFIHKDKIDLTKILLNKFYHRSLKLERNQTELF